MRIAFFTECFRPTRNGVVVSVETFAQQLTEMGHEVHVFAPRVASYPDVGSYAVHRFPSLIYPPIPDYPLAFPYSLSHFRRFQALGFDLVHAQSPWLLGRAAAYLARRCRLPLVMTYHTAFEQYLHYLPAAPTFTRPVGWWLLRRYAAVCDLVLAPSPEVAAALRGRGALAATVETLPTGVEVDWIAQGCGRRARKWLELASEDRLLLYVGRMAPEKNVEFLLRSLAPLLRERKDTYLVCVGGGWSLASLGALAAELGVADRIRFVGAVPREAVRHFLAASDLFVFASLTETQGLVIAEALAAGLPIVALDGPGVSSAITGREGFLCPPIAEVFHDRVAQLLNDDTLRGEMGRAARVRAADFSARHFAEELIGHYETVIRRRAVLTRLRPPLD